MGNNSTKQFVNVPAGGGKDDKTHSLKVKVLEKEIQKLKDDAKKWKKFVNVPAGCEKDDKIHSIMVKVLEIENQKLKDDAKKWKDLYHKKDLQNAKLLVETHEVNANFTRLVKRHFQCQQILQK